MNQFYIREKNLCLQNIKQAEVYKRQAEEKVKNLRGKGASISDFEKSQIEKTKLVISSKEKEVVELKERLEKIQSKSLDAEYYDEISKAEEKAKSDNKKTAAKIAIKEEEKKANTRQQRSNYDNSFVSERQLENYGKKFFSVFPSEKIRKNLKEMPSNKGYIFKGIWFFGELPAERNRPVVMFESIYNSNVFRTYEIDDKYRYVYEKSGKGKRVLVSKEQRSAFGKDFTMF